MRLSIVIPVYNAAAQLDRLIGEILKTLGMPSERPYKTMNATNTLNAINTSDALDAPEDLEIILVDDGSTDDSFALISEFAASDQRIRGIRLSRNFGQQHATLCGLRYASGDFIVTLDDDQQHPVEAITAMLSKMNEGYDIVYGIYPYSGERVRTLGSQLRDWLFTHQIGKPREIEISSFRVMTRALCASICSSNYRFPYISALVLRNTKNIGNLNVQRRPRAAGHSGYTFWSLCRLYWRTWLYYGMSSPLCEHFKIGRAYKVAEQTHTQETPGLKTFADVTTPFQATFKRETDFNRPKLLMLLGAGRLQINAVRRAQELGYQVLAVDYDPTAPAKKVSDYEALADVFDFEACLEVAEQFRVDGVMTTGTDQPVLTAARIAKALNLPSLISIETALGATHKAVMKDKLKSAGIPTAAYGLWRMGDSVENLETLMPGVVKPVDSQGQRGIFYLEHGKDLEKFAPEVFSHTKSDQILVERYIEGDEVTFSGWVRAGVLYPLTLTDRVTFSEKRKLGICTAHEMPSRNFKSHSEEILNLSKRIVETFEIENGPIYIQYLLGEKTVVNELACRIGGAYEDEWMPVVTGCDWLRWMIDSAMGQTSDFSGLALHDWNRIPLKLSAQLFFSEPGQIRELRGSRSEACLSYGFNFEPGQCIPETSNATQRAGYFVVTAKTEAALDSAVQEMYARIGIALVDREKVEMDECGTECYHNRSNFKNAVMVQMRRQTKPNTNEKCQPETV